MLQNVCVYCCIILNLTQHVMLLIILPVFVRVCLCVCLVFFSAWGNKRNPLEYNNAGSKKDKVNKGLKVTIIFSVYTHVKSLNMDD